MTKVIGTAKVLANLANIGDSMIDEVSQAIGITAVKVQKEAIKSIREVSHGREVIRYTDGGRAYKHIASKEGDAPNTDTGQLINSLAVDFKRGDMLARTYTNADYAYRLETDLNRPFLLPALENTKEYFEQAVKLAITPKGKK
jgi:hypothetical protein